MASTIIDNVDAGFTLAGGGWNTSSYSPGYYGTDYRYVNPGGSGGNIATWTFTGLTPGTTYYLGLSWVNSVAYGTSVPYSVLDGVTVIDSGTLNQSSPPGDFTDTAQPWKYLGAFTPTGTTLAIRISDNGSNGYTNADAALLTTTLPIAPGVSKVGDHYADLAASWVGDVLPTPGVDTITISAGSTIRVRDQQDWGLDTALPTSSFDVTIKNTGKVLIEDGGTLTLHGNVDVKANTSSSTGKTPYIDIEDGGKLEFYDAYYIRTGETAWQYRYIKGRGEFEISTRVGASAGGLFVGSPDNQQPQCDFIGTDEAHQGRILRMGSASVPWFNTGTTPGGCRVIMENVYTDGCGSIAGSGIVDSTDTTRFKNFTTFNTLGSYSLQLVGGGAAISGGEFLLQNVALDKGFAPSGMNLTGCVIDNLSILYGVFNYYGVLSGATDICVITPADTGGALFAFGIGASQITRPIIVNRKGNVNEKLFYFPAGDLDVDVDDALVVHLGPYSTDGEYAAGTPSDGGVVVFNNAIFMPYKDGSASHTAEKNTETLSRVEFRHITSAANGPHSIGFGHSGMDVSVADCYRLLSSIIYNFSSVTNTNKISWISSDLADCIDPTQADYNCGWGLTPIQASRYSNPANGYQQKQTNTSVLPGVHDVDVDPWPTRTQLSDFPWLHKWAATLGITGTNEEDVEETALRAIHARFCPNHADYVAGATNIALGEWYKQQMKVNNILLATAGHDGEPIGAGEYVSLSGFTPLPSSIPKNHPGPITITLTGTGTSWDGTTVFSISGVAGITKVSQNVSSGTSATIVVTTHPTNTGTLTITESITGDHTATVAIGTASFSISPSTGLIGATPSLTLTGTNTVWSQELQTDLLSISGGAGAALATPIINSDTSITVTLAGGSGTGTLTITDTSTGATNTFGVAAATAYTVSPSGSTSVRVNKSKRLTFQANGTTSATVTISNTGSDSFGTVNLNGTTPVTKDITPTDISESPLTVGFSSSLTDPADLEVIIRPALAGGGGGGGNFRSSRRW